MKKDERYLKLPFEVWDGKTPLCLFLSDTYFFSEDEVIDYLHDNYDEDDNVRIEDLELVICTPNNLWELDGDDLFEDIIPENFEFRYIAPDIEKALKEVNKLIKEQPPVSWSEGNFRTEIL